jgi:hypothetical protein
MAGIKLALTVEAEAGRGRALTEGTGAAEPGGQTAIAQAMEPVCDGGLAQVRSQSVCQGHGGWAVGDCFRVPRWGGLRLGRGFGLGLVDHFDEDFVGGFGVGEGRAEGDADGGVAAANLGDKVHALGVDAGHLGGCDVGEVAVGGGVEDHGIAVVVVHMFADAIADLGGECVGHGGIGGEVLQDFSVAVWDKSRWRDLRNSRGRRCCPAAK